MGEPVSLLGFFISAANSFAKLIGWFRNEDRADKDRIATYFDQIAACMREVAERVEAGDPPRDTCRRLAVYANELRVILGKHRYFIADDDDPLDETTRSRLIEEVGDTLDIWSMTDEKREAEEKQQKEALAKGAASEIFGKIDAAASQDIGSKLNGSVIDNLTDGSRIDSLTGELENEFTDNASNARRVWDAAGEFKALADTLRAS
jgi:hypothetical protein